MAACLAASLAYFEIFAFSAMAAAARGVGDLREGEAGWVMATPASEYGREGNVHVGPEPFRTVDSGLNMHHGTDLPEEFG